MPTVDIPAQRVDPTGVAAGVKRFRADVSGVAIRGFDWPLLAAAIGLVVCSIVVINGATQDDIAGSPDYYVIRQTVFAAIGLLLLAIVARVDYTRLREFRTQIYALLVGTNLLVLLVGAASRGSRRWFNLGFFQLQPSELGKVLLVVSLAAFVADRSRDRSGQGIILPVIGMAALPAALVFIQPDLGTAMVYGAITLAILFIAGIPWQQMTALFAVVILIATSILWAAPAAG